MSHFETMLSEVADGAALPHVLGWWEFYGRRFELDPSVLIPRPETELMVDTAIRLAAPKPRVLDIGTGSGCIAITLTLELSQAHACATDISFDALRVAKRNIDKYAVERNVALICTDLAASVRGPFDLVCANLPYIASEQLASLAVAQREPTQALDGGLNGTALIRRTIRGLPGLLSRQGVALFEIDELQAEGVLDWAKLQLPFAETWIEKDLAGKQRLLVMKVA